MATHYHLFQLPTDFMQVDMQYPNFMQSHGVKKPSTLLSSKSVEKRLSTLLSNNTPSIPANMMTLWKGKAKG